MYELKVRTEYIVHRMPKEYFFLKEIQDLFTEFSVENYNIGKEIVKNFMIDKSHFFQSYSKQGLHDIPLEKINN